jgi:hypothetical protein
MIDNETGELVLFFYPVKYGPNHPDSPGEVVAGFHATSYKGFTAEEVTFFQQAITEGGSLTISENKNQTPSGAKSYSFRLKYEKPKSQGGTRHQPKQKPKKTVTGKAKAVLPAQVEGL